MEHRTENMIEDWLGIQWHGGQNWPKSANHRVEHYTKKDQARRFRPINGKEQSKLGKKKDNTQ